MIKLAAPNTPGMIDKALKLSINVKLVKNIAKGK